MATDVKIFIAIMTLVVAGGVWAVVYINNRIDTFKRECVEREGHTVRVYKGHICVSEDGRIIEW